MQDVNHAEVIAQMRTCTKCLLKDSRTQVVVGDYGPKRSVCFIGEAPGYNEDVQGRPFVGRSGKLLDRMLKENGWTRKEVSVLNIVKCRPPNNRTPSLDEKNTCGSTWLTRQIKYLEPLLIVTLGATALTYFKPELRMTASKGKLLMSDFDVPIFPIFHPSYILRNGNKLIDAYKEDFKQLRSIVEAKSSQKERPKQAVKVTESEETEQYPESSGQQSLADFYS